MSRLKEGFLIKPCI